MSEEVEATFEFEARKPTELNLRRGDVIVLTSKEKQWWEGRQKGGEGKSGKFPSNYVTIIFPGAERREQARAKFDFAARKAAELSLPNGAQLTVINRDASKKWWKAEYAGRRGLVPETHIELLFPESSMSPPSPRGSDSSHVYMPSPIAQRAGQVAPLNPLAVLAAAHSKSKISSSLSSPSLSNPSSASSSSPPSPTITPRDENPPPPPPPLRDLATQILPPPATSPPPDGQTPKKDPTKRLSLTGLPPKSPLSTEAMVNAPDEPPPLPARDKFNTMHIRPVALAASLERALSPRRKPPAGIAAPPPLPTPGGESKPGAEQELDPYGAPISPGPEQATSPPPPPPPPPPQTLLSDVAVDEYGSLVSSGDGTPPPPPPLSPPPAAPASTTTDECSPPAASTSPQPTLIAGISRHRRAKTELPTPKALPGSNRVAPRIGDDIPPPPLPPDIDAYPFADPDTEMNIRLKPTGELCGATIPKLIAWLTDQKTDPKDARSFVIAFRMFLSPDAFFSHLRARFSIPQSVRLPNAEAVQLATLTMLREWLMASFPSDFLDNARLLENTRGFLGAVSANPATPQSVRVLAQQLPQLINLTNVEASALGQTARLAIPSTGDRALVKPTGIMEIPAESLARQLTLVEFDLIRRISPMECLRKAWSGKDAKERAPNIARLTDMFNRKSRWIEQSILTAESTKERSKLIKYFIDVAQSCLTLGNFNGMMVFLSGLQSRCISRLKKPWSPKKRAIVDDLSHLIENNFKELRRLQSQTSPCVPYIGMSLTDLTFIEDGNPDFLPETGLINWNKIKLSASVIERLQAAQHKGFEFSPDGLIISIIRNLAPTISDSKAYEISLHLEPKEKDEKK